MIWFYRMMYFPVFAVLSPYYIWRMIKRGGYYRHFSHRFGLLDCSPKRKGKKRIWIQAVSVGEIQAVQPLINKLIGHKDIEVFLTTTTSTGYKRACDIFKDQIIKINFFPLDCWVFSYLAWNRVKPDLCILMESELWPEHIHQSTKRGIPILLMNGRISDRSFTRYKKCRSISRYMLKQMNAINACSEEDKNRFVSLGANANTTAVVGNLKMDLVFNELSKEQRSKLKAELGFKEEDLILMGASTWPNEEKWLVEVQKAALKEETNVSLLLVPRHAERRKEIIDILSKQELKYRTRSQGTGNENIKILLADTTGELKNLLQVADVVFVGKSLCGNKGGQTPIEVAAAEKSMVYGPHMENFRTICKQLESIGGSIRVKDEAEGAKTLRNLLRDQEKRILLATRAKEWLNKNKGAIDQNLKTIEFFLKGA